MIYLLFLMSIASVLFIILGETLFADELYLYEHFKDFVEGYFTTFVLLTQVPSFDQLFLNIASGWLGGQVRLRKEVL